MSSNFGQQKSEACVFLGPSSAKLSLASSSYREWNKAGTDGGAELVELPLPKEKEKREELAVGDVVVELDVELVGNTFPELILMSKLLEREESEERGAALVIIFFLPCAISLLFLGVEFLDPVSKNFRGVPVFEPESVEVTSSSSVSLLFLMIFMSPVMMNSGRCNTP